MSYLSSALRSAGTLCMPWPLLPLSIAATVHCCGCLLPDAAFPPSPSRLSSRKLPLPELASRAAETGLGLSATHAAFPGAHQLVQSQPEASMSGARQLTAGSSVGVGEGPCRPACPGESGRDGPCAQGLRFGVEDGKRSSPGRGQVPCALWAPLTGPLLTPTAR